jgi:5-methylcytosine-specific restriction endonuclease McrA
MERRQTYHDCEFCGNRFGPLSHLNIKFCSYSCKVKFQTGKSNNSKGKKYPHLQRAELKICVICNKLFRAVKQYKGRITKYCSKSCWSNRSPPMISKCLACDNTIKTYERSKKYCSNECRNKSYVGRKLSDETRSKMSIIKKGIVPKNHWKKGNLHPNWIEDKSERQLRDGSEYDNWRLLVLKRDNFTCQICSYRGKKGLRKQLNADHIKPWSLFPKLRFELDNGRTLCIDCHVNTPTYGLKTKYKINQKATE